MGRGKSTLVRCSSCGRNVPRTKAVMDFRPVTYSTDLKSAADIRYTEKRKCYYCVSCGKSLGIYQRKKEQAIYKRSKEQKY
jgi:ribosomal protein S26